VISKQNAVGRGRPRTFDPAQAVEIAQRLFHAHGYDNVGVVRLAKEIGIEQPSLYSAFGNKLGLFEAVVERYAASEGAFIASAFAESDTVLDGVHDMLRAAADLYSQVDSPSGCLIMEGSYGAHDEGARSVCLAKRSAVELFIADYVDRKYSGRGIEAATMAMIALAGLSASARAGVQREQLRKFALIAFDGIQAIIVPERPGHSTFHDLA
jgi:TetR/AcrR family transcriptional regulator, repressor for divergent bdcA